MPGLDGIPLRRTQRLALALVSALGLAGSLAAADRDAFGLNVHAPRGAKLGPAFDRAAESGVGWIRIDFVWADVERSRGEDDWDDLDAIVAAATARGLAVLALVGYTPAWATDGAAVSGVPRDPADWADFCARAALRYRGAIRAWEIWNEPNLPVFWSGSREAYLRDILLPAAAAIRAADPTALVGGPALAHHTVDGRDWPGWLLDVAREAGGALDFVSHHLYAPDDPADVFADLSGASPFGDDPSRWNDESPSVREVLAFAGYDGPLWLTETGWVTTRRDETRQKAAYERFLTLWRAAGEGSGRPEKVFFYELQDDASPAVAKFGLLRASGRKKPSFRALQAFFANGPAVPDPVPPEAPEAPSPRPHPWHRVPRDR